MRWNRPQNEQICPEKHEPPRAHEYARAGSVWQQCRHMGRFGTTRPVRRLAICAIGGGLHAAGGALGTA